MRVLVCGGRDYERWEDAKSYLDGCHASQPITEVIHGAARGADSLAGRWARLRGIKETPVPADWNGEGRAAGPRRNERMLAMGPDVVISFPGGVGTAHMVKIASRAGVEVRLVND